MAVNYQIQRRLTALSHAFNQSLLHYLYPSLSSTLASNLKSNFARVISFYCNEWQQSIYISTQIVEFIQTR